MKTYIFPIAFIIAFSLIFVSCNTNDNDATQQADQPAISVTHITLNASTRTVGVGATLTGSGGLIATVWPQNATDRAVIWSSSDPLVATVSGGEITGISEGTATVTATTRDGDRTETATVTVVPPIAVTGIALSHTTLDLDDNRTFTITATISPGNANDRDITWATSDTNIATVANGVINTVRGAAGTAEITVTTNDGGFTATAILTVGPRVVDNAGCNANTPAWGNDLGTVGFASTQTWTFGSGGGARTWSDAVTSNRCNKGTFAGGAPNNFNADCRSNPNQSGNLFSWCAVHRFGDILCPAPWRVPTTLDFMDLDRALAGTGNNNQNNPTLRNRYVAEWGAVFGGRANANGALFGQGWVAHYWSQWEFDANNGQGLILYSTGVVHPQGLEQKSFGFTLRCVRDGN